MTGPRSRRLLTSCGWGCAVLLAACSARSSPPPVTAAPAADGAACTAALAAAPATVADLSRTPLPVAGTLSWGEPGVVLRCGLDTPAPTTKPCLGVDDVDWIVDVDVDPFVFVTYGRRPAVELRVPAAYGRDRAVAAVTDVGPVARALPSTGRACVATGGTGTTGTTAGAGASGEVSASPSGG